MRVLLTGGSGFIGRHVAARLRVGHEVLAPSHVELDLTDADAMRRWLIANPVDAVVHTAAKPGHRNAPDLTDVAEANLRLFFSLVRCRTELGRFVVITSGATYGIQRSLSRVAEDELGMEIPTDGHGFSKYVEALWLAGDRDAVELRPFGVYGPGEDYAIRFISNACCKALTGIPVTLRQDRLFSYVWVQDLAVVVERALDRGPAAMAPGAYNVTPGEPVRLASMAELVVQASGRSVPVVVAQPGLGLEYSGDGSKLATALPSTAFTSPAQGVEQLVAWYEAHLADIDLSVLEADR